MQTEPSRSRMIISHDENKELLERADYLIRIENKTAAVKEK